jgi:hypothetical protein
VVAAAAVVVVVEPAFVVVVVVEPGLVVVVVAVGEVVLVVPVVAPVVEVVSPVPLVPVVAELVVTDVLDPSNGGVELVAVPGTVAGELGPVVLVEVVGAAAASAVVDDGRSVTLEPTRRTAATVARVASDVAITHTAIIPSFFTRAFRISSRGHGRSLDAVAPVTEG